MFTELRKIQRVDAQMEVLYHTMTTELPPNKVFISTRGAYAGRCV